MCPSPSQRRKPHPKVHTKSRNEKTAQRESLRGGGADILRTSRGHSCGRPGSKTPGRPSEPWKNKHLGADIHDPNARTSMTPGGAQKNFAQKLRANDLFPEHNERTCLNKFFLINFYWVPDSRHREAGRSFRVARLHAERSWHERCFPWDKFSHEKWSRNFPRNCAHTVVSKMITDRLFSHGH